MIVGLAPALVCAAATSVAFLLTHRGAVLAPDVEVWRFRATPKRSRIGSARRSRSAGPSFGTRPKSWHGTRPSLRVCAESAWIAEPERGWAAVKFAVLTEIRGPNRDPLALGAALAMIEHALAEPESQPQPANVQPLKPTAAVAG